MRRLLGMGIGLGALALGVAPPAWSAVFIVGSNADAVDVAPGNGSCDADPGAGVTCTLRAAVQEANALGGSDVIQLGALHYSLSIAGLEENAASGDLDVKSAIRVEGAGAGATVIDQSTADRVFEVWTSSHLELADLTITGGDVSANASNLGGAIRSVAQLLLDSVEVTGNTAYIGGGIYNYGELTIWHSVIAGNTADQRAGGLASASYQSSGNALTTLEMIGSTVGPNTSGPSDVQPSELELANAGNVSLTNVTVSPASTIGKSVEIGNQDAQLVHVTILGGLGLYSFDGSHQVAFTNSAIERCESSSSLPILTRLGVNASTDASCGFVEAGAGVEGAFALGPLADNGGPTPTHLPGDASVLISAADDALCAPGDQRGAPRPQGAHCDIGAVEVVPEPAGAAAGIAAAAALAWRRKRRARG